MSIHIDEPHDVYEGNASMIQKPISSRKKTTNRGILYHVWGDHQNFRPEYHGYEWRVNKDSSDLVHYQKRANLFTASPFDLTLHLDTDTQILGEDLDFGFEMAYVHGIAVCIAPASSAWNASHNMIRDIMPRDLPQYNCGVIFFDKVKSKPVFDRWRELLIKHPESAHNDQPYFAQAVYENLNPYVLPKTWNYRPHLRYESDHYHGDLKILHSHIDPHLHF